MSGPRMGNMGQMNGNRRSNISRMNLHDGRQSSHHDHRQQSHHDRHISVHHEHRQQIMQPQMHDNRPQHDNRYHDSRPSHSHHEGRHSQSYNTRDIRSDNMREHRGDNMRDNVRENRGDNRGDNMQTGVHSQHDDLIKYIYDSWNKVEIDSRGNTGVVYYQEHENHHLKDFRAFDLEAFWGRRMHQSHYQQHHS